MKKCIYLMLTLSLLVLSTQKSFADSCIDCKMFCANIFGFEVCEPASYSTCEATNLANPGCSSNAVCQALKITEPMYNTLADAWQYAYDQGVFNSKGECENIAKLGKNAVSIICDSNIYCSLGNILAKQENLCFCRYEIDYWRKTPPPAAAARIYGHIQRYGEYVSTPAAGAKLIINNNSTNQTYTVYTDSYGDYSITIPPISSVKFSFRCETYDGCKVEEWQETINPGDNKVNRTLQPCK